MEMQDTVKKISDDVKNLSTIVSAITVIDAETNEVAAEYIGHITKRMKRIEELRTSFVRPLNEQVKFINNSFKKEMEPLEKMEAYLKGQMKNYIIETRRKEQEEAEKKRLEFLQKEKEREELIKSMTAEEIDTLPAIVEEVVEETPTTVRATTATVSAKKQWKYEIVDVAKLMNDHPELFIPDPKAVSAFVKDIKEEITISGVRIYEDIVIAAR